MGSFFFNEFTNIKIKNLTKFYTKVNQVLSEEDYDGFY